VTTDDLTTGQPAATRTRQRVRAGALRILCCVALCAAGTSAAFAQSAPSDAAQAPTTRSTHVRPIFGDLAELDPGTTIVLDASAPKLTDRIQGVLSKAMTLLGTPYRWGGESPDGGFDCSGLVGYVYRTVLGMDLPRVSRQMARTGEAVDRTALAPGDLVFFGRRGRVSHVGIYVGEGRFLHAPSRGKDVRVDSLASGYWSGRYLQGRRVAM
jgi:cell wall-associated NlpC family hydrolase